jgi:hypothetical protein
MLAAGEDPRFIARRIVIFASEDVGMADPTALTVATSAAHAVEYVGLPEAQLNLAQAVVHLATAPKSNTVTTAIGAALADVRAGRGGAVPRALRDSHYSGSRGLGHGTGYRYPHDDPPSSTCPMISSTWTTTDRASTARSGRSQAACPCFGASSGAGRLRARTDRRGRSRSEVARSGWVP